MFSLGFPGFCISSRRGKNEKMDVISISSGSSDLPDLDEEHDDLQVYRQTLTHDMYSGDLDNITAMFETLDLETIQRLQHTRGEDLLSLYLYRTGVGQWSDVVVESVTVFLIRDWHWHISMETIQEAIYHHSIPLMMFLLREQYRRSNMMRIEPLRTVFRAAHHAYHNQDYVLKRGYVLGFYYSRYGVAQVRQMLYDDVDRLPPEALDDLEAPAPRLPHLRHVHTYTPSYTDEDEDKLYTLRQYIQDCKTEQFDGWQNEDVTALERHLMTGGRFNHTQRPVTEDMQTWDLGEWLKSQMSHRLECANNNADELDLISREEMSSIPSSFIFIHDNICFDIIPFYIWARQHQNNPLTRKRVTEREERALHQHIRYLLKVAALIAKGEDRRRV